MKPVSTTTAILAIALALGGCATHEVAGSGATVRAIMASQIAPSQRTTTDPGVDAAAAVAAHANYQRSYVTPVPHGENSAFGGR